ncbi:rna-directed dna polymerase from mobile element jockey- hypothetical protein [Limosa lapponica baueri]|uniref:Rna-directed dna polymerase from mobile element jockey-like n=1 Tax=Limosa lapponica baueri TaxID=1758121 RepID=A0A2I0UJA7_LIMLA|nr:rna-directed dna polymerase from mobile element jockey- hypothetical protein [Limosa lapponica baueri]
MLEGRDAIQRDLDSPERWAHANLMKFSQAKCRVLHLGHGSPRHKYRLGGDCLASSTEEKDLEVLVDENLRISWQCSLAVQKANCIVGCKKCVQQVVGGDSTPVLRSRETPPGVRCPALESSTQEGHGPVGTSSAEGHENNQQAGAPLL